MVDAVVDAAVVVDEHGTWVQITNWIACSAWSSVSGGGSTVVPDTVPRLVNTNRPYRPNAKVAMDAGVLAVQRRSASVVPVQANAGVDEVVNPPEPTRPLLSVMTLPTYVKAVTATSNRNPMS
jgi:hypothetical protein